MSTCISLIELGLIGILWIVIMGYFMKLANIHTSEPYLSRVCHSNPELRDISVELGQTTDVFLDGKIVSSPKHDLTKPRLTTKSATEDSLAEIFHKRRVKSERTVSDSSRLKTGCTHAR